VRISAVIYLLGHPSLFFFFCSIGFELRTQGLILARQALYHLSHASSPFCVSYFSDMVLCFCLGLPQTMILLLMPTV
jgi:hypothetical protein